MKTLFLSIFIKIILVVFIPMFIGTYIIYTNYKSYIYSDINAKLSTKIKYNKKFIFDDLDNIKSRIKEYGKLFCVNKNDNEKILKTIFYNNGNINEMILLNKDNRVEYGLSKINFIPRGKIINLSSYRKNKIIKKENDVFYNYILNEKNYKLIVQISIKNLFNKLIYTKGITNIFILDSAGNIIFHNNFNYILANRDYSIILKYKHSPGKIIEVDLTDPLTLKTKTFLVKFDVSKKYSLIIGTEIEKDKAYYPLNVFFHWLVTVFIILILLIIFICYLIAKNITKPIESLGYIADKVSEGVFDFSLDYKLPNNEIGKLGKTFENMAKNIQSLIVEKDNAFNELSITLKKNEMQNKKLYQLFDTVDDGIYVINKTYEVTMINEHEINSVKKPKEEILGKKCYKIFADSEKPCELCPVSNLNEPNSLIFINLLEKKFRKSCTREKVNISFYPFGDNEVLIKIQDVTKIYEFMRNIQIEKEKLETTLKSIGDGVIVTDHKGNITLLNNVAEKLLGCKFEDCKGKSITNFFKIINEETREPIKNPVIKVFETKKLVVLSNHTVLISKDGSEKIIEDSASPIFDSYGNVIGVVLVVRDSTQKKLLEREMSNLDKLNAVGRLAAGIAHDFNNILTALYGNISYVKKLISSESKAFEKLLISEQSLDRAISLTTQLLTFAKGGQPVKQVVTVNNLIDESLKFTLAGSNVEYKLNCDGKLYYIYADEGQISQVFQNIILNAKDAMQNKGGLLEVFINKYVSKGEKLANKGDFVEIIFKDNGEGIEKENLYKIFEPFYTTKEKGSGLGLATCHSIITNHDGNIFVESDKNLGTVFTIYIPCLKESAIEDDKIKTDNTIIKADENTDKYKNTDNNKKILVLDDEESILNFYKDISEILNFDVETVKNGDLVISKYKESIKAGEKFDIIVLDLTVPNSKGADEIIKELLIIDKDVNAYISSGYSENSVIVDFEKYGFKGFLKKPFTLEMVIETFDLKYI